MTVYHWILCYVELVLGGGRHRTRSGVITPKPGESRSDVFARICEGVWTGDGVSPDSATVTFFSLEIDRIGRYRNRPAPEITTADTPGPGTDQVIPRRGVGLMNLDNGRPAYPEPGSEIPDQPGFVVGTCGHRLADSEWRAGIRTCERCLDQPIEWR